MSKSLLLLLLVGLLAIVGCGSGAGPVADESAPGELLLSMEDLPEGSAVGEAPPELCGPLPVLERDGGRTAVSKMFVVGNARIAEAVGVFDAPGTAAAAYRRLNAHKRIECIGNAIATFSSGAKVEVQPAEKLNLGEESDRVRYLASDAGSKPQGYTDVISIRTGPCTVSLLVVVEGGDRGDRATERVGEKAAEALNGSCR